MSVLERSAERDIHEMGDSPAVTRFLGQYPKASTRASYSSHLKLYFRWLRSEKRVMMSPDELVKDNLLALYKSAPEDVVTKRKHNDWLAEYVNMVMLRKGLSDSKRLNARMVINSFFRMNDSPLFGTWKVALGEPTARPKIAKAEEIRKVLLALSPSLRTPFLCQWQSGCEVGKILTLKWEDLKDLDNGRQLIQIGFNGRKSQRQPYFTYLGQDSIEHLKALRGDKRSGLVFRSYLDPTHSYELSWLNERLKLAARKLARASLIEDLGDKSWHSHMFRHSFMTLAAQAGIESEIREFFCGRVSGVRYRYIHAELLEDYFETEYRKVEPYVSLNPSVTVTEARLRAEFGDRLERLERAIGLLLTK